MCGKRGEWSWDDGKAGDVVLVYQLCYTQVLFTNFWDNLWDKITTREQNEDN